MIKLVRIDDRLVHGQVAFTWVSNLGIDCMLVANDKASQDEFLKMTLGLAKPPSAKLLIYSVEKTIAFLNDPRSKNLKILVIVNCVDDAYSLAMQVDEIQSLNFGGLRTRDGAKLISKAIALTDGDIQLARQLSDKGIELEIRQVPTDKKIMVQTLI